ncbi:MAG: tetratricopeptide repeat protein [Thermoanaerobaculia bacterium]
MTRLSKAALALLLLAPGPLAAEEPSDPAQAVAEIRSRMYEKDFDGAVTIGEKSVADHPNSSEIWLWLGRAYGRKAERAVVFSQFALARKCKSAFEKAVALDPKNVNARSDLISYYLQAPGIVGGSLEKAKEQAAAILQVDPERGRIALERIRQREKNPTRTERETPPRQAE